MKTVSEELEALEYTFYTHVGFRVVESTRL